MGVAGGCRIGELVSMSVDDVDDRGNVLVVQIPDTKTYRPRVFTVVDGGNRVHSIDVFRKYKNLRPEKVTHKRLFLNYQNEKCTVQPVGLNTFAKMPQKIAEFLGLSNAEQYVWGKILLRRFVARNGTFEENLGISRSSSKFHATERYL
jgi:integrase